MSVYAKTLTAEWRESFERYEGLSGFEPMHQDAIDSGEMSFREAWNLNVDWIRNVADDCNAIPTPYDEE